MIDHLEKWTTQRHQAISPTVSPSPHSLPSRTSPPPPPTCSPHLQTTHYMHWISAFQLRIPPVDFSMLRHTLKCTEFPIISGIPPSKLGFSEARNPFIFLQPALCHFLGEKCWGGAEGTVLGKRLQGGVRGNGGTQGKRLESRCLDPIQHADTLPNMCATYIF